MAENKTNHQAPDRFIRRLQKAMKEHPAKLSLNEIARRADLSPAYLSFLLHGKRNVPSNDAIARLAEVLNIPQDELHQAAGKPNDAALDFFRKGEAGPIMRSLAKVPAGKLPAVRTWIEQFVQEQKRARGK